MGSLKKPRKENVLELWGPNFLQIRLGGFALLEEFILHYKYCKSVQIFQLSCKTDDPKKNCPVRRIFGKIVLLDGCPPGRILLYNPNFLNKFLKKYVTYFI